MARTKHARRYDLLAAIRKNERANLRELARTLGLRAPSAIYYLLNQLEDENLIWRSEGTRNIHLGPRPADQPKRAERKRHETRTPIREKKHDDNLRLRSSGKSDPGLQSRIDGVVAKAAAAKSGHTLDVVNISAGPLFFRTIKASKIG